jgi:hypothetical protein
MEFTPMNGVQVTDHEPRHRVLDIVGHKSIKLRVASEQFTYFT